MNLQQLQSCTDPEFLDHLAQRKIELRIHDGKLRISAPVGAVDDALKSELLRRKEMLLASAAGANATKAEDLNASHDRAPLSYAQERLWVLERFHPGNFAYNIPESFEINAAIDRELIQRAIDAVVRRHAVLRTSIHEDEQGKATQQVHAHVSTPLQVLNLSKLDATEKGDRLRRMLRELAREPFDLRVVPMVRFYLIQLDAERHIVFINIHHIISDRWSMRVLNRELLAAYYAYAAGREPELEALPIQYTDYARRERSPGPANAAVEGSRSVQEQLQYWQKQLAGAPDPPELPFKLKPAVLKPFDGAISPVELTEQDTAGVRSLARAHGASPYMVLLAAYAVLLHRFTRATDVCIGSPVSERSSTDTEGLIGLFVNTLVMRCTVPAHVTFSELLRGVRETVLDAQAHHEVPLQRILSVLRESHPAGVAGSLPLFQTMLAFDSYMGEADSPPIAFDPGSAKFELTLQMWEGRDRIGGFFEYRTDLFAPEAIAKFATAFVLLLRNAIQEPSKEVARLATIPEDERSRLLYARNATAMEFPRDRTIHQLFEEQVDRTPNAIAVVDGKERFSYSALNSMANRVARGLITQGVRQEAIVGVRLERSVAMIAAMLGILKAGGAYLPLDTQYPEERLRFMIEDSGCAFVLSNPSTFAEVGDEPDRDPALAIAPSNLAYVIYTSGSTGRPKGVAIEHHSTVSFLHWGRGTFPPEVLRGTLAATSISFDLSVFEIFLPLICGHSVILAKDIVALPSLPAAAEVTLVTTVPSAAAALLAAKGIPATLRAINLAGEPLSTRLVDRLYAQTAVADVNDLYGPTETTTYSTWNRRLPGRSATIGRPVANTRVYLVDASLHLVPDGFPGELLIAGEGVARGYLGRPELTAEKFVSLAHLGEQGRAYRTGDLCRYTSEGALEYLGRMDSQVKVRGFRIEAGEVEAALLSHPSVREAVVMTHAEDGTGATLVGAVVLQDAHTLDVPALIAHQSRTLPAYMVAGNIVAVEEFPRTANGKIDRKQLTSLPIARPAKEAVAKPRDPLEKELADIWREGFSISNVGIDDDFFQLGGHSLLALRIFSEIEAKLGHRMMLSVLFQAPTIRQLAEHIRRERPA